jgi:apolipoprotein N-acyltransferase
MNNNLKNIIFSVLSGLLLYLAWPNNGIFPLLFIGFIPLLFSLENLAINTNKLLALKSFFLVFVAFLTWSSLSLIWLYKTAVDSHFITASLTALNYSFFLAFFPFIYKRLGKNYALIYFASALLLVDWLSQVFLLATPYFNLGLGLGQSPWLIQHYKWIGIEGGSLWIIATNLLIYKIISEKLYTLKVLSSLALLVIVIPVLSVIIYQLPSKNNNNSAIVTLHHTNVALNTSEAFENPILVIDKLFDETFTDLKETPDVVVWPETVIIRLGWLHRIDTEPVILHLKEKLKNYPKTIVVFGAIGFSEAKDKEIHSRYSTYVPEGNYYFNTHNVAVTVSASNNTLIKSKEKFIPFHERIPYINTLPFLTNLISEVGTRAMFTPFKGGNHLTNDFNGNQYESVLCYESLFSLYMGKKSTKHIGAFLVHANEHWLKDIAGSEQYLYENVAIAVQGGKPLLRSSNSGVSAVITEKGDIVSSVIGLSSENITSKVNLNYRTTFYSKIAGSFYAGGGITCLLLCFLSIIKKNKL